MNIKAKNIRFIFVIISLFILLLLGIVLNIAIGSVNIPLNEILKILFSPLRDSSNLSRIIINIRLPRMFLAIILGGGLSVSGFLLQAFFKNPIAGPFVLGISSGSKMAVGLVTILLTPYSGFVSNGALITASFLGAMIVTIFVILFANRSESIATLLVAGIMTGYICNAVTDFLITFADSENIANLTTWSMGTFSGANWDNVKLAFIITSIGVILSWSLSKPMEAYSLGEGYAKSMGIRIKPLRIFLIVLSGLLSGCVTALAGPVSFVGIAVPHITKSLLKTAKPLYVIPATFVCGSVFCVFCDLIARCVFAPIELSIGTVTSIFGAPIVIYIMIKRKRSEV